MHVQLLSAIFLRRSGGCWSLSWVLLGEGEVHTLDKSSVCRRIYNLKMQKQVDNTTGNKYICLSCFLPPIYSVSCQPYAIPPKKPLEIVGKCWVLQIVQLTQVLQKKKSSRSSFKALKKQLNVAHLSSEEVPGALRLLLILLCCLSFTFAVSIL